MIRDGFFLASLIMVWTAQAEVQIDVTLNGGGALQDGQVLKGIVTVVALVQSEKPVSHVEFLVDDRRRASDQSTPYEFVWDTIPDAEAEHTLTIAAYSESGLLQRRVFKVKIDNEIGKGEEYHYERAKAAFQESQFDEAILAARVALKARSEFKPARLLLIQAYLSKSRWREAEDAVEEFVRLFADSPEGYQLRAQVALRKARTSREEAKQLGEAIQASLKALQLEEAAAKSSPPPVSLLQQAASAFTRGDYETAANLFLKCAAQEENKVFYWNRLGQTYLRAGRYQDTLVAMGSAIRHDIADDYSYALQGVAYALLGRSKESEAAFKQAESKNPGSVPRQLAQAYLAMREGRFSTALRNLSRLLNERHPSAELHFLLMWAYASLREFDRARDQFWRALDQNPLLAEVYVLRGYENLVESFRPGATDLLATARDLFELALKARPNEARALLGLSLSHALALYFAKRDGETPPEEAAKEAERYLTEALKASRSEAWSQVGAAVILEQLGRGEEAQRAILRAHQLDKEHVETMHIPTLTRGIELLWRLMFPPLLPNPSMR